MRRRLHVAQRENVAGDFWYAVLAGNGEPVTTSKMYPQRWLATRAARAFIASINPAPVRFTWWSGPTARGNGRGTLRHHSELIR